MNYDCRDPWGCDGWCRCQPNPYRFTVEAVQCDDGFDAVWWLAVVYLDRDRFVFNGPQRDTQQEAELDAELIRQAMREVS